jgi:CRISPR-associated protein Csm2
MSMHGQGRGGAVSRPPRKPTDTMFQPDHQPRHELFDRLAEQQAKQFPDQRDAVPSAQLRRFFGEIKQLFRRLEARTAGMPGPEERDRFYVEQIEPLFKMIRSKVSYASRAGQAKIPREFADALDQGIQRVHSRVEFELFVRHWEAVVGFMYGLGRIKQ